MDLQRWLVSSAITLGISVSAYPVLAAPAACAGLPSQASLQAALDGAVAQDNGGLGFDMWATIVANDGTVCAVARNSGTSLNSQWLGSRVISAQKANTATDFNIGKDGRKGAFALSTANLYSAVQPGGSLYGLQHSNPVDATIAYEGNSALFGTADDPLVGTRVGG